MAIKIPNNDEQKSYLLIVKKTRRWQMYARKFIASTKKYSKGEIKKEIL